MAPRIEDRTHRPVSDRDVERINQAVLDRPLVILDGYSGVGKTSLLQNGLYASLADSGFDIIICRLWPKTGSSFADGESAVERYLAEGICGTHQEHAGLGELPGSMDWDALQERGGLREALDQRYAQTGVVVILDQFEELLRQPGGVGQAGPSDAVRARRLRSSDPDDPQDA